MVMMLGRGGGVTVIANICIVLTFLPGTKIDVFNPQTFQ